MSPNRNPDQVPAGYWQFPRVQYRDRALPVRPHPESRPLQINYRVFWFAQHQLEEFCGHFVMLFVCIVCFSAIPPLDSCSISSSFSAAFCESANLCLVKTAATRIIQSGITPISLNRSEFNHLTEKVLINEQTAICKTSSTIYQVHIPSSLKFLIKTLTHDFWPKLSENADAILLTFSSRKVKAYIIYNFKVICAS